MGGVVPGLPLRIWIGGEGESKDFQVPDPVILNRSVDVHDVLNGIVGPGEVDAETNGLFDQGSLELFRCGRDDRLSRLKTFLGILHYVLIDDFAERPVGFLPGRIGGWHSVSCVWYYSCTGTMVLGV